MPSPASLLRHLAKRLPSLVLALVCVLPFVSAHAQTDPPVAPGTVRIHYHRPDGAYSGWALYTWNASTANNSWCSSEINPAGTDSFGVYFDVPVDMTAGTPARRSRLHHQQLQRRPDQGPRS